MEEVEIGGTCRKLSGIRNSYKKLVVKSQSDWM
jgi:hypothetical protein